MDIWRRSAHVTQEEIWSFVSVDYFSYGIMLFLLYTTTLIFM